MAWIDVIHEQDARGELRDMYDSQMDPWGGVDNVLKIHSLDPASLGVELETMWDEQER